MVLSLKDLKCYLLKFGDNNLKDSLKILKSN